MAGAKKTIVMQANLDALWEAITDYESYSDFVDGCESATVLKRTKNTALVEYKINKLKKFSYTLEHKETKPKKMTWTMTEGEFFKSNDGSWTLKDLGDGEVEVTYEVEVGMPALVPKAIVKGLVSSSLPEMLDAFENRAAEIAEN